MFDQVRDKTDGQQSQNANSANLFEEYLSGKPISHPRQSEPERLSIPDRVKSYGKDNFDFLDVDRNGFISMKELDPKTIGSASGPLLTCRDPLALKVLIANYDAVRKAKNDEWELGEDEAKGISKTDLARIENVQLKLPPTEKQRAPHTTEEQELIDRAQKILGRHADSLSGYEGEQVTAIKAMTTAILRGDSAAFDAMVKEQADDVNALATIVDEVNRCLKGSDLGVTCQRAAGGAHIGVHQEEFAPIFYPLKGKPYCLDVSISAGDALGRMSDHLFRKGVDGVESRLDREDLLQAIIDEAERKVATLKTPLTGRERFMLKEMLYQTRSGDSNMLGVRVCEIDNDGGGALEHVVGAMNEILSSQKISASLFRTPADGSFLQFKAADGTHDLTLSLKKRGLSTFQQDEKVQFSWLGEALLKLPSRSTGE